MVANLGCLLFAGCRLVFTCLRAGVKAARYQPSQVFKLFGNRTAVQHAHTAGLLETFLVKGPSKQGDLVNASKLAVVGRRVLRTAQPQKDHEQSRPFATFESGPTQTISITAAQNTRLQASLTHNKLTKRLSKPNFLDRKQAGPAGMYGRSPE